MSFQLTLMRSGWGVLLLVVLIPASMMQLALSADYTPSSLTTIVYSDGVVGVEYHVEAAPTAVRVSLPLFGSTYTDLLVVNQDGLPLVTTQAGSTITVDSLGASRLTITYSTQELTSKLGTLWTLNVTSPVNLDVLLPSGATIVSISQIPLRVETFSEHPSVTLPPGVDSVSYVVSAVGTNQRAQSAIQAAEAAITTAKASGLDTTAAEALLTQAKTAYNAGEYLKAEQLATQAKSSAQSASKTPTDNTPLIVGGAVVVVAAVAGILLYRRRRVEAPTPQPPAKKSEEGPVDLEAVFQKHPDLRVDDKEVIRFLSEHGGEAFANEIRDRFDIPRTSAWRMIRRLITTGIVEERKIGGQSLIYVVKKYRGAQV
ncbi:MAG: hypothetical protein NTV61_11095 [Candidatus Bathyarchaeota archaeon]|nr:hypothetical protein [Candidatus Bathyarchaeota archaeon]